MAEHVLSRTTRLLHWSVALVVMGLLGVGLYMTRTESFHLYGLHKSVGTLVFALIMVRVVWRVKKGWPTQASTMPNWQKTLSRAIHWVLITGTLLMPLSGLIGTYFGGRDISIFDIILVAESAKDGEIIPRNETLGDLLFLGHEYIAYAMLIALALHIAGAFKHHFIDKDNTLRRVVKGK